MFFELEADQLGEIIQQNSKVMVQYGATWCGNCKVTKPKFKKMAELNPDTTFVYVDAEKMPESRKFADVSNLPTFASFSAGNLAHQAQGNKIETIQEVYNAIASN
ncbi:MAG: thioredoxin family protein [Bacteroidetes bacterium]|nr:thioredoxin family protein [Bacteroidota bacterium]